MKLLNMLHYVFIDISIGFNYNLRYWKYALKDCLIDIEVIISVSNCSTVQRWQEVVIRPLIRQGFHRTRVTCLMQRSSLLAVTQLFGSNNGWCINVFWQI